MKRLYKICLTLGMVTLLVTGCGSTATQSAVVESAEVLENTTVVIGRLIEVAGNQITVQIGEYAATTQRMGNMSSDMQMDAMPGDMAAGEVPEGMAEDTMPERDAAGEMPEGMGARGTGEVSEEMQERMASGEMPEGMGARGTGEGSDEMQERMASGEMSEGMSGRGAGGMGETMADTTTASESPSQTTTSQANTQSTITQQAPTETTEQSGEMPSQMQERSASGEMGDRSAMGGEMAGNMDGGMSGGMPGGTSDSSSTSYGSVEELKDALISNVYSEIALSDVYEVYTIPVGTPVDQYGVETTFLQLTEKSYVSIVFNEAGVIVSMEVLGG